MNVLFLLHEEGQVSTDMAWRRQRDVIHIGAEVAANIPFEVRVAREQKHVAPYRAVEPTVTGADNRVATHAPAVPDLRGLRPAVEVAFHRAAQIKRLDQRVHIA